MGVVAIKIPPTDPRPPPPSPPPSPLFCLRYIYKTYMHHDAPKRLTMIRGGVVEDIEKSLRLNVASRDIFRDAQKDAFR